MTRPACGLAANPQGERNLGRVRGLNPNLPVRRKLTAVLRQSRHPQWVTIFFFHLGADDDKMAELRGVQRMALIGIRVLDHA
jgi:hypothetical protein